MNHSKVLHNLRSELFSFAKSISNKNICNAIVKVAMDFDDEFFKWIKSKQGKNAVSLMNNAVVYDSLFFLETLRSSHLEGMSKPDFVKYFVGTSNSKYLPTLLGFADVLNTNGSMILESYANILNLTDVFSSIDKIETPAITEDLSTLEHQFREHLSTKIDKPFGDDPHGKPKKLNRNEKKKALFFYMIDHVSAQVANALQKLDNDVVADQVRENNLFMVDDQALKSSGLLGPERDLEFVDQQASEISKKILKRIDPEDNEYNYNFLVNSAMNFTMAMTDETYQRYFYQLMLQKAKGDSEIRRMMFGNHDWVDPNFVTITSLVLLKIMSQIKF